MKSRGHEVPLGGGKFMAKTIVKNIRLDKLKEFYDHPFQEYSEEKLTALAESIKEYGLQNPIIVRPINDTDMYEIIAGHNRARAVKLNGGKVIAAIIKTVSDDEAKMIMAETNLRQREKMRLSEKVLAYAIEAQALTSQGKLVGTTKRKELQKMFGESGKQIERYLHLSHLITPLLKRLDNGELSQNVGVTMSQLDKHKQEIVNEYFSDNNFKGLDMKIAQIIKENKKLIVDTQSLHVIVEDRIYMKNLNNETICFKKNLIRIYVNEGLSNEEIIQRIIWLVAKDKPKLYYDKNNVIHYQLEDE